MWFVSRRETKSLSVSACTTFGAAFKSFRPFSATVFLGKYLFFFFLNNVPESLAILKTTFC